MFQFSVGRTSTLGISFALVATLTITLVAALLYFFYLNPAEKTSESTVALSSDVFSNRSNTFAVTENYHEGADAPESHADKQPSPVTILIPVANRESLTQLANAMRTTKITGFDTAVEPKILNNGALDIRLGKSYRLSLPAEGRSTVTLALEFPGIAAGDIVPNLLFIGESAGSDVNMPLSYKAASNILLTQIELSSEQSGNFFIHADRIAGKALQNNRYLFVIE